MPGKKSKRSRSSAELAESAFAKYGRVLHRYLLRRLENAQTASDLAQEAYLRLLRLEHSELVRAPQAYLFTIAANLIYEFKMREKKDVVIFDSHAVEQAADETSDPAAVEPGEQLNMERQLEAVLSQLPPAYAAILIMKKRDGKSLEEIAKELNLSIHTVKKYLFRAVVMCREAKWDL